MEVDEDEKEKKNMKKALKLCRRVLITDVM